MGATLSSRTEWTSASEKGGKLDFSKADGELLLEILKHVETLCRDYPREASVQFKRPFLWKSSLVFSQFNSLSNNDYIVSESGVVSTSEGDNGEPYLKISKLVEEEVEIQAINFTQLYNVLECAGENKLREVQLCLEANQDPIAVIMGSAYSQAGGMSDKTNTLLDIHERLARDRAKGNDGPSADDLDSSFRLLLLLNNLDIKLLYSSVKQMGKEVRLSPEAVATEMELLSQFCGVQGDSCCLKDISYTSDLVFSNGCRAPPWRQVVGDICYIKVDSQEGQTFYITACTEGYYVNKGLTSNGDMDNERVGNISTTLVKILKENSSIFASKIGMQDSVCVADKQGEGGEDGKDRRRGDTGDTFGQQHQQQLLSSSEKVTVSRKNRLHQQNEYDNSGIDLSKKFRTMDDRDEFHSPLSSAFKPRSRSKLGGLSVRRFHNQAELKSASTMKSRKSHVSTYLYTGAGEANDSESSSEASEDEEAQDRKPESNADLPSEYWQIQKLIKYLRGGNQTSTVIALCSILDFDLSQEACQLAIRDSSGMDLLVNLLETDDIKCKIGTLRIMREISKSTQPGMAIIDLGGVPMLVDILGSPNRCLKCLAAETIAHVAKFRRARRLVRLHGGIKKLVSLLENPGRPGSPITGEQSDLDVARSAALGLWRCSKSKRNKIALLKTGAVPLLGKLLSTNNVDVLIPVVGTLQECASERTYQKLIHSEGMIEHLVRGLKTDVAELQKLCASAIFKCVEEEVTQSLVREHGGLDPLASLLTATDMKDLLCAVTGAVWKCSKSRENVTEFKNLKAIEQLVSLLSNQPEEVLVNVVGALAECAAKDADVRVMIRKAGGVIPLVQLLTGTNQALLINTTKAVGACALDPEGMIVIDKQDGVRLLWSLLKSPNTEVQACAAWAICPCIQNAKDAGELVRSFVGGLELIVGLLKSLDREVLAGVCAAIAKIAQDEENLGVITDHGVVLLLAKLTETCDDLLRKNLSDAIARCCMWRNNRVGFGEASAVAPLVSYLQSSDPQVHRSTACALHQLSKDPNNCITMHEAEVVQPLLAMVSSSDEVLQEAAAGCINSIRQLALANEKEKHK